MENKMVNGLLPLFLRKETTKDPVLLKYCPETGHQDVVAYYDAQCTQCAGRWSWLSSRRPDKRFKRIILNCYLWRVVWLDSVPA